MSQPSTTARQSPAPEPAHRLELESVARTASCHTITSIAKPVERISPQAIATLFGDDLRFLWRDPSGRLHAASGCIASIQASGTHRFEIARRAADDLYQRIVGPQRPIYGGFAFEPDGASSRTWQGFGDARFELPRLSYIANLDEENAELAVNLKNPTDPAVRRSAQRLLDETIEAIGQIAAQPSRLSPHLHGALSVSEHKEHYLALVASARDQVLLRSLAKVVVARKKILQLSAPADIATLLGKLDDSYHDCYLLCVRGETGTLVAASPERLIEVTGERVESVALAGTVALSQADVLLSNAKLQIEHQLTVSAIANALATSGCMHVTVDDQPRLRRLRHLVHLETRVAGQRKNDAHIFELAAALHPTPAVAGIPTAKACQFIREHESTERGWYAGLVGWCDARGDGELAVALRAGLIDRDTVRLYAGAGIVGDSDPDIEFAETSLKFSALESHLATAVRTRAAHPTAAPPATPATPATAK